MVTERNPLIGKPAHRSNPLKKKNGKEIFFFFLLYVVVWAYEIIKKTIKKVLCLLPASNARGDGQMKTDLAGSKQAAIFLGVGMLSVVRGVGCVMVMKVNGGGILIFFLRVL